MRELYRPSLPVARLLIVAMGLVGLVAGPAGSATQGATSSTGTITGVRTGAAQHVPARTRASTKPRPGRDAQAVIVASARQALGAAAPDTYPAHAALPSSGVEVRPTSTRAVRPAIAPASPYVVATGVPRGRAPPSTARI